MNEAGSDLREFFEIQNELTSLMGRFLETIVSQDGITVQQVMTLKTLKSQDRMCKMSDVAAMRFLTPAAATGIVDRLIHMGLVERKFDANDRRVVLLALTPEGENKLTIIEHKFVETMERFLEGVSESDRSASLRMFRKLRAFLKEKLSASKKK
jgi:DNA-binding MarR family transcriptional regulator